VSACDDPGGFRNVQAIVQANVSVSDVSGYRHGEMREFANDGGLLDAALGSVRLLAWSNLMNDQSYRD
jgi:hypothetical protein